MRAKVRLAAFVAGTMLVASVSINQAVGRLLSDPEIRTASVRQLVESAREAQRTENCVHFDGVVRELIDRQRRAARANNLRDSEFLDNTWRTLDLEGCPPGDTGQLFRRTDRPAANYSVGFLDVNAGVLEQKGATHGFLGVDIAGTPILPFSRFQPTQTGQFFSVNAGFPLDNGGQLFFNGTLFQSSGSAFQEPTLVPGDFLLIPFVETSGVSLNNIADLAALGPQSFRIQHQGFAFTTTYAFPPLRTNGTAITPLVHVGVADKVTESSYLFTVPGYTAAGRYGSDVNQLVLRAGAGARVETPVPDLLSSDVVARRMTLFVEGRLGLAHHRVASGETVDLSVFGGALTFAEATTIHGNATGVELTARGGFSAFFPLRDGSVIRAGASVFYNRDSRGSFTRLYAGGAPVPQFGTKETWGFAMNLGTSLPSDVRLKRDVALLTRLENGAGLYRYRYLWSDTEYVGVMAQEVAAIVPEAVVRGADGYLRVDYARLGLRLMTWDEFRGPSLAELAAR
jgi:hypothetical protein